MSNYPFDALTKAKVYPTSAYLYRVRFRENPFDPESPEYKKHNRVFFARAKAGNQFVNDKDVIMEIYDKLFPDRIYREEFAEDLHFYTHLPHPELKIIKS